MTVLSVQDVSLHFGGVHAVSGVSLAVEANSLLGFIGPNGAGKTTLMRIITGVLRPQAGKVVFNGQDITNWPVDRRVRAGLALGQQLVRPLRSLSILDNVALAAGSSKMQQPLRALFRSTRDQERETARELLAQVGLSAVADSAADALPLGYLKRLEVARALALKPSLLLLDEPLAGLNQGEAKEMADLIAGLVNPERSLILIEHNIKEVARICPRLYVQDNGKPLIDGPTDQVMRSDELRRAYLGA